MNLNSDALKQAYQLALDSGKVESGRLMKAVSLIPDTEDVSLIGSTHRVFWVPSSTPNKPYIIWYRLASKMVEGCQCPDHKRNMPRICKHMAAVMLIIRSEEIAQAQAVSPLVLRSVTDTEYRKRMVAAMYPKEMD